MKICFATKKDTKLLREYFKFYNDAVYSAARIKYFLNYGKTIIAKEGSELVGLMQWHIKENPRHGLAELEEVFVHKDHRKKGIATKLINFAIASIRKEFAAKNIRARKVMLFVLEENLAAQKLYENAGFVKAANVGELFADGKNDLFYVLDL